MIEEVLERVCQELGRPDKFDLYLPNATNYSGSLRQPVYQVASLMQEAYVRNVLNGISQNGDIQDVKLTGTVHLRSHRRLVGGQLYQRKNGSIIVRAMRVTHLEHITDLDGLFEIGGVHKIPLVIETKFKKSQDPNAEIKRLAAGLMYRTPALYLKWYFDDARAAPSVTQVNEFRYVIHDVRGNEFRNRVAAMLHVKDNDQGSSTVE